MTSNVKFDILENLMYRLLSVGVKAAQIFTLVLKTGVSYVSNPVRSSFPRNSAINLVNANTVLISFKFPSYHFVIVS